MAMAYSWPRICAAKAGRALWCSVMVMTHRPSVPPSQQEAGQDYVQQGSASAPAASNDNAIETVSLQPDAATSADTPESLYERSNESLLRRQFGETSRKEFWDGVNLVLMAAKYAHALLHRLLANREETVQLPSEVAKAGHVLLCEYP